MHFSRANLEIYFHLFYTLVKEKNITLMRSSPDSYKVLVVQSVLLSILLSEFNNMIFCILYIKASERLIPTLL